MTTEVPKTDVPEVNNVIEAVAQGLDTVSETGTETPQELAKILDRASEDLGKLLNQS